MMSNVSHNLTCIIGLNTRSFQERHKALVNWMIFLVDEVAKTSRIKFSCLDITFIDILLLGLGYFSIPGSNMQGYNRLASLRWLL